MSRKIRYGMIGGGRGAFIGAVHRSAAAIDQQIELVCGAFSSDPERSRASGGDLFLPPERCYGSFEEMIRREAALPAESGWILWPSSRPITSICRRRKWRCSMVSTF
jgi:hypothetical protein